MENMKNLSSPGEAIAAFTDGDVEDELLDFDVPHWVRQFPLRSLVFHSQTSSHCHNYYENYSNLRI